MVEKITCKNGVRIVHEALPHLRSCALGLWVESGSRHEPEELCGVSHFIEHMLFKGTETRSASDLAADFDAIGGQVNAFTTKEHTCYYARTLDTHLPKAAELLSDMFFHSTFKKSDVDLERSVIMEEIGMYEDTPEDLVNEQLSSQIYQGYSLGRPILGYPKTLKGIDSQVLSRYRSQHYTPENTVVSLCGNYSQDNLKALQEVFEAMPAGSAPQRGQAEYQPSVVLKKKDIEQNHLIVGYPGIPVCSDDRFTMQALNNILGGGMSSRLYQTVREQRGLCYSVYSFVSSYFNTGYFGVYTALSSDTEADALAVIREQMEKICSQDVEQDELSRTKEQLKSNVLLGLESTISRMSSIARNELCYGHAVTPEEVTAGIDAVTGADIRKLASKLFTPENMSFSAVGQIKDQEKYTGILRS